MSLISVPVSFGELLDKITILEIKSERISDETKLANVRRELRLLEQTWSGHMGAQNAAAIDEIGSEVAEARAQLKAVNEKLWDIEDRIRVKESRGAFDEEFIELARSVYITNDDRAAIKKRINLALGSELVEEKSYQQYA